MESEQMRWIGPTGLYYTSDVATKNQKILGNFD